MSLSKRFYQHIGFGAFITIISLVSCVDIIDFPIDESQNQLVIIGAIDTEPGPYDVTIYYSSPYSQIDYGLGNVVKDAKVTISSDDGETEELINNGDGTYSTRIEGIRGGVGKSYTLTVLTSEGQIYQSSSEKIIASPEIDSMYFNYEEKAVLFNGIEQIDRRANLIVDFQDEAAVDNYYSWSWQGTYKFESNPELFVTRENGPPVITPLPCSFNGCSCCTCWVITPEINDLAILSDKLNNGSKIIGQQVGSIPINGRAFRFKYHVEIKQKTLSARSFEFWSLVKDQETASTISSTPPAQIKSNISNINETEELVWGIFTASDISTNSFFIDPRDIPNFAAIPNDTIRNDCIVVEGSTRQKPVFWP